MFRGTESATPTWRMDNSQTARRAALALAACDSPRRKLGEHRTDGLADGFSRFFQIPAAQLLLSRAMPHRSVRVTVEYVDCQSSLAILPHVEVTAPGWAAQRKRTSV